MKFKLTARSSGKSNKYIDNLPLEELIKLKRNIEKEFCKTLGIDYKDLHKHDRLMLDEETARQLLAFEIIKHCFTLNGFDELIPNELWWDHEKIQDFVKEVLKNEQ